MRPNDLARFWAKVNRGTGCWEWLGERNNKGYGRFPTYSRDSRKRLLAHRVSYTLHHGQIPAGVPAVRATTERDQGSGRMSALYVLDTFCAAGGAGVGYYRAGLMPVGIEKDPLRARHYPFPVHVGDALAALRTLNAGGKIDFVLPEGRRLLKHKGRIVGLAGTVISLGLGDIVLEHGSPPCQGYSRGNAGKVTDWPRLIPEVRELFIESGLPYVIENVMDARPEMKDPVYLCGCMFDLSTIDDDGERIHLQRARAFETSFDLKIPRVCEGEGRPRRVHPSQEWVAGAYGGARRDKHEAKYVRKGGYVPPNKAVVAALLGIEHPMTWDELFESIPPAFTEHIGTQFMEQLTREAVA